MVEGSVVVFRTDPVAPVFTLYHLIVRIVDNEPSFHSLTVIVVLVAEVGCFGCRGQLPQSNFGCLPFLRSFALSQIEYLLGLLSLSTFNIHLDFWPDTFDFLNALEICLSVSRTNEPTTHLILLNLGPSVAESWFGTSRVRMIFLVDLRV